MIRKTGAIIGSQLKKTGSVLKAGAKRSPTISTGYGLGKRVGGAVMYGIRGGAYGAAMDKIAKAKKYKSDTAGMGTLRKKAVEYIQRELNK